MGIRNLCSVALLLWLASPVSAQRPSPEPDETPVVRAVRAEESVVLDGVLDEAAWSRAEPETQFLQKEPREGAPASEATESPDSV